MEGEVWRWDGYVAKGKQNASTKAVLEQLKNRRLKQLSKEEKDFASKLYMSSKHIKEMYLNKMFIGLHGTDHLWLKYLNKNKQEKEIKNSLSFFSKIGIKNNISMASPYGSYNKITLKLLKKYKIKFAFTTNPGSINSHNLMKRYLFPRYDHTILNNK